MADEKIEVKKIEDVRAAIDIEEDSVTSSQTTTTGSNNTTQPAGAPASGSPAGTQSNAQQPPVVPSTAPESPVNPNTTTPKQSAQEENREDNRPENGEDDKDLSDEEKAKRKKEKEDEEAKKKEEEEKAEKEKNGEEKPGEKPSGEPNPESGAGETGLGESNLAGGAKPPTGATGSAGLEAGGAEAATAGATETAAAGAEAIAAEAAAAGTAVAEGATAATTAPIWLTILGILIIICLLTMAIFGVMACQAASGSLGGKSSPQPAGKNYENSKKVLASSAAPAKSAQGNPIDKQGILNFNQTDKDHIENGKADKRLMDVLNYLKDKHLSLSISHIVEGYQDMTKDPESGAERNSQIASNVSAHKEGMAADIATVDYVYKTLEPREFCQDLVAAACGPGAAACKQAAKDAKWGDLVYQADKSKFTPTEEAEVKIDGTVSLDSISIDVSSMQDTIDNIKAQVEDSTRLNDTSIPADFKQQVKDKISKINLSSIQEQLNKNNDLIVQLQKKVAETASTIKDSTDPKQTAELKKQQTEALAKLEVAITSNRKEVERLGKLVATTSTILSNNIDQLNQITQDSSLNTPAEDIQNAANEINGNLDILANSGNIDALNKINTFNASFDKINQDWSRLTGSLKVPNLDQLGSLDLSKLNNLGDFGDLEKLSNSINLGDLNNLGNLGSIDGIGDLGTIGDEVGGVFGSDSKTEELLRLPCMGNKSMIDPGNVDWTGSTAVAGAGGEEVYNKAVAIPIKVAWQDQKPTVKYVSADKDDCMTYEKVMGPLVCTTVFRPEARRKVNQLIQELLQYPVDAGNKFYYRVTQIITYSKERDVDPFFETLKEIYGLPRSSNFGLFAMPESWAQIHVAY